MWVRVRVIMARWERYKGLEKDERVGGGGAGEGGGGKNMGIRGVGGPGGEPESCVAFAFAVVAKQASMCVTVVTRRSVVHGSRHAGGDGRPLPPDEEEPAGLVRGHGVTV